MQIAPSITKSGSRTNSPPENSSQRGPLNFGPAQGDLSNGAGLNPDEVRAFLDYLAVECGLSVNTLDAYRLDLRVLDEYLLQEDQALEQWNGSHISEFLRYLSERGYGLASVARHHSSLKMFLRFEYSRARFKQDLSALMETPKKWRNLPGTIPYKKINALLEAPDLEDEFRARDRALLETLYATGMRVSELTGLRLKDINLKIGFLRCLGKGRKERIVPIGRTAIDALETYLDTQRCELLRGSTREEVFLSRTGHPLDRTNCWRIVRKYARRIGLKGKLSPHTLRHCFATHMLQGGADLRVIQELLGHADVSTTQVYTHVDHTHLKNVHRRFHPRQ
jgi:integrase/recombinase XerD